HPFPGKTFVRNPNPFPLSSLPCPLVEYTPSFLIFLLFIHPHIFSSCAYTPAAYSDPPLTTSASAYWSAECVRLPLSIRTLFVSSSLIYFFKSSIFVVICSFFDILYTCFLLKSYKKHPHEEGACKNRDSSRH